MNRVAEERLVAQLDRWRKVLQELVQIPSEFEGEHRIVARIESILVELGCSEVHRVCHDPERLGKLAGATPPFSRVPGRYSLVAVVRGTGKAKSLIFNTHLDAAPVGQHAAWKHPPFSGFFEPEERRVYGRGAVDDKAGVVTALAVIDLLLNTPVQLRGDVIFHFVLEDEITGNGSLLCLDEGWTGDAALILDGTRLDRAIRQHAGQLAFGVEFHGRAASVSVAHVGINAAELASEYALQLKSELLLLNANRPEAWRIFPSPCQCSLLKIESVGGVFTLPELAKAEFFITFCEPDSLATVRARVETFTENFAGRRQLPITPKIKWSGLAAEPVASPPSAIDAMLQQSGVTVGPSTGTSDMRHFAAREIPCLLYGPGGGENPHRANEYFNLDDLPRLVRFCVAVAEQWCVLT